MGSISDFSVGTGSSVLTTAALTGLPTAGMRTGDLAFVATPNVGGSRNYWSFDPASVLAVGATVVLADIARGSAVNPGRWRRTTIQFNTQPNAF